MIHRLKPWPEFFEPVLTGEKRFELRRDDRCFQVGTPSGVGHGPARHRVRAVQFLSIRHATPNSCYRYYVLKVEHGAALPAETTPKKVI